MALITPVAGAYLGTYTPPAGSADSLGILQEDGFELQMEFKGQNVDDTDQYAATLIDGIVRGMNATIRFRTKEWAAGVQDLLHTLGKNGVLAAPAPILGVIARKYTDLAGALILTSTTGTPAVASPATLTASGALLSQNNRLTMNFTSKVREVPVEMMLLPYTSSSKVVWWVTT